MVNMIWRRFFLITVIVFPLISCGSSKQGSAKLKLATQNENGQAIPKDIPELAAAALKRARQWKKDAAAVSFEYKEVKSPNQKGPEVRFSFISPSDGTGFMLTLTENSVLPFEFKQKVDWGVNPLPPVFVDLPVAIERARKNGMQGPLIMASLRVYDANGVTALAWMISAKSGGRTIDGATGDIIEHDVTGYIDYYNEKWAKAAAAFRAMVFGSVKFSQSYTSPYNPSENWGNPGGMSNAEWQQSSAESNAYWSGNSAAYDRVKNGQCTWSDSSNYGC